MEYTDYHEIVNKDTPLEERRKLNIGNIWINRARCLKCEDIIQSNNRKHFVSCKCGAIAIQGGSWSPTKFGNRDDFDPEYDVVFFTDIEKYLEENYPELKKLQKELK